MSLSEEIKESARLDKVWRITPSLCSNLGGESLTGGSVCVYFLYTDLWIPLEVTKQSRKESLLYFSLFLNKLDELIHFVNVAKQGH